MRSRTYLNIAITAVGILLGLNLLVMVGAGTAATASAAPPPAGGTPVPTTTNPFNSADQRKQLIDSMSQINDRLARIEAALNKGINVKVTDMPAIKVEAPSAPAPPPAPAK